MTTMQAVATAVMLLLFVTLMYLTATTRSVLGSLIGITALVWTAYWVTRAWTA